MLLMSKKYTDIAFTYYSGLLKKLTGIHGY